MSGVAWSLTMKNPMCGCRVLYQQPALPTNVTQSSQIAVTPRPGPGPVPSRYTPRLWAPFSVPRGTVTSRVIVCSSTITTLSLKIGIRYADLNIVRPIQYPGALNYCQNGFFALEPGGASDPQHTFPIAFHNQKTFPQKRILYCGQGVRCSLPLFLEVHPPTYCKRLLPFLSSFN